MLIGFQEIDQKRDKKKLLTNKNWDGGEKRTSFFRHFSSSHSHQTLFHIFFRSVTQFFKRRSGSFLFLFFRRLRFHVLFFIDIFCFLSNFFLKIVFVLAFLVIVLFFSSFFYGSICFIFILLQVNVFFSTLAGTEKNHIKDFFFEERGFVKSVNNVERLRECFQLRPLSVSGRHW